MQSLAVSEQAAREPVAGHLPRYRAGWTCQLNGADWIGVPDLVLQHRISDSWGFPSHAARNDHDAPLSPQI
jgi:hypothetical protein